MRFILPVIAVIALSACSDQTQQDAQETAVKAAADTRENAEVVENAVREGTIVAADKVSEGAERLGEELRADERDDPVQGDNALDGTD